MKKIKYNNKGVTLIELLIVLAIMVIILQVIYSLFFVGNKSFNTSKNKGFAQQDARIASTLINSELRTAKKISISPFKISELELEEKYYSLTLEDDKLFKKTFNYNGSIGEKTLLYSNLSNLKFKYIEESEGIEGTVQGFINIVIEIEEGKEGREQQSYEVDFDILLENIPDYNEKINVDTIYYLKYD